MPSRAKVSRAGFKSADTRMSETDLSTKLEMTKDPHWAFASKAEKDRLQSDEGRREEAKAAKAGIVEAQSLQMDSLHALSRKAASIRGWRLQRRHAAQAAWESNLKLEDGILLAALDPMVVWIPRDP